MKVWKSLVIGLLLFSGIGASCLGLGVNAQGANLPEQWIVDPHSVLSFNTLDRLNHMLAETASKQGIYIRVFILNEPPLVAFEEQILDSIFIWEAKHPYMSTGLKLGYLGINAHTREGKLFLGAQSVYSPYSKQGLYNLETYGVVPALVEGDIEKAIFQGVIGLSTLLKDAPILKSEGVIERLIVLYDTSFAFHCLVLAILFAMIGGGIVLYLRDPKAPKTLELEVSTVNQ